MIMYTGFPAKWTRNAKKAPAGRPDRAIVAFKVPADGDVPYKRDIQKRLTKEVTAR
jgi:hypothetical protein